MSFEVIKAGGPHLPERLKPFVDLSEWLETDPIQATLRVGPDIDETGLA